MKRARLKVTLSQASADTVRVAYATKDGTAKAPTHYTATSGTLTFAPGERTQDILVPVVDPSPSTTATQFTVELRNPVNATLLKSSGIVRLGAGDVPEPETGTYLERFLWAFDKYHDRDNGYFGPPTGPNAKRVPYHAIEKAIVVEAPDWTHESVSETASFHVKAAAWHYIITGDATELNEAWKAIVDLWIPNTKGQPWGDYDYVNSSSTVVPEAHRLQDTPVNPWSTPKAGPDPLYMSLKNAYGTDEVFLMHWLIDVDGDYGFKNPDGSKQIVFINNYQRGAVEDGMATITHGVYDDFANGGNPQWGWQAIYGRENPPYTDATSPYGYSKQVSYSMAGDADVRAVDGAFVALRDRPTGFPAQVKSWASKNGAYIQYTLYDKHFRPIPGFAQDGCHYLLSWGCGFGVGLPVDENTDSYWGFRIGNSEIHHGYNGISTAYACRTGAELASTAVGVPDRWAISLDRQLEMVRWLQTPEGPIAGGVSSNWRGRYETPSDGRELATFYGCYYNYSPSWFNPPSNNWSGFQGWGMQRIAEVAVHSAKKGTAENDIYTRCMVILDKWVAWFYNNCEVTVEPDRLSYPINLSWTSPVPIAGETATVASPKFVGLPENKPLNTPDAYEYIPTLEWPGANPDYAAFWAGDGSVPNPTLKCTITEKGWDPGTAAGFAQILIQYAYAKQVKNGSLAGSIPNTSIKIQDVLQMAADIMDVVWRNRDDLGFGSSGSLAIGRLNDKLWVPPEYGTGYMPDGSIIKNGETTFWSMRESFYLATEQGPAVKAWLDSGADESSEEAKALRQVYHRYWNGADVAVALGMLHYYFPDLEPNVESNNPGTGGAETGAGH